MKIGVRLMLSLAFPLVALMVLFGYLDNRRSRAQLEVELAREGRGIARVVQLAMERVLRDHDDGEMRHIVEEITGYERILGLRVFDAKGNITYQSPILSRYPVIHRDALRMVLRERKLIETRRLVGNQPVVTFIIPVPGAGNGLLGAVQVHQLESFIEEDARSSRNSIILFTAVMIGATCAILFLVTRMAVIRPIEELITQLRRVGSGTLSARSPVRRTDEFGRLTLEFNRMCGRLEVSQRSLITAHEERHRVEAHLRNTERLASIGRLAAGLAHQIGTPLAVIGGRTQLLLRKCSGVEVVQKNLQIIARQNERIARVIRELLDVGGARNPILVSIDLTVLLREIIEFLEHEFEKRGVSVEPLLSEPMPLVDADADQVHKVFLNLAMNALEAMPGGGALRIGWKEVVRSRPEKTGTACPFLAIRFEDTGSGVPPKNLDRLFDPFFTTKDVGSKTGKGLGLPVAYHVMQDHGGWIEIESKEGHGTCVSVYFPLERERMPGAAVPEEQAS
jgi:two-component system NtrC family sensor kinase